MIDSTNPRQLADNIRKLWDKVKSISGDLLPSRSTATTGQILKLTGENKTPSWADGYTPPAYSTTEVNTGQKWIDGKYIYCRVYGLSSYNEGVVTLLSLADFETLIGITGNYVDSYGFNMLNTIVYNDTNTLLIEIDGAPELLSLNIILFYTKPTPAETRDDTEQEPETKKTTRKKTTK